MKIKNLFITTISLFLIAVPTAHGMEARVQDIHPQRIQSIRPFELNRKSVVMAENKQKTAAKQSQSGGETQEHTAEPEAAVKNNSGSSSDDAKTKPLKPFKPSEEIAAEQAVDFPVDI